MHTLFISLLKGEVTVNLKDLIWYFEAEVVGYGDEKWFQKHININSENNVTLPLKYICIII